MESYQMQDYITRAENMNLGSTVSYNVIYIMVKHSSNHRVILGWTTSLSLGISKKAHYEQYPRGDS